MGGEDPQGTNESLAGDLTGSIQAIEPILSGQSSADWWISNKDKGLDAICKQLLGKFK